MIEININRITIDDTIKFEDNIKESSFRVVREDYIYIPDDSKASSNMFPAKQPERTRAFLLKCLWGNYSAWLVPSTKLLYVVDDSGFLISAKPKDKVFIEKEEL